MSNFGSAGETREVRNGTNRQLGDYLEVVSEGTQDYILTLYAAARTAIANGDMDEAVMGHRGSLYTLTTRAALNPAGPVEPTLTLRGDNNRVQKSIFEPPTPGDISSYLIETIQGYIRDPASVPQGASLPWAPSSDAAQLYNLALAKVEFRTTNQRVIHVTRSAPVNYQWPDRGGWVDRNLDHGQMIADSGIAGILNFTLPAILAPVNWVPVAGTSILMYYGWLKHEPIYDTSAGERSVESLTYEFGLWPVFLYPLAV